jgi:Leucine-rich repeat (LRR) protein
LTHNPCFDTAFNDLTGELSPEFKDLQLEILRLNGNTFSGSLDEAFCTDHPVESLTADCLDPETNIDCSCCAFCCNAKGLECTSTAPDPGSPGGGTLTPDALNEKMETLLLLLEPISGDALKDSNSHQSKVIHWMAQMDHNSPYFEDMDVDSMIQMYIMILIYVATEGMSWNSNRGWLNGTDTCSWQGISCNEANLVTEINLAEHNLIGTLVSEIGVLGSSLQSLILKDNPSLTGDLPSEVGQLTKLSTLDVSGCNFSGHLPHEVGGLSSISFFNIEKNSFSGSLPSEIINGMGRAKTLLLGSNGFTGKIPVEIAGIESLERLTMSGCSFSGAIPPQLSTLSSLSYLDLSQNALDGSIPSNLGSLTDLEKLLLGT